MGLILRTLWESLLQAFGQLWGNKLRSSLSLLGITIGIWCVISVLSAINSLEYNIRGSFDEMGEDVLYFQKENWQDGSPANFWKYFKRPAPSLADYKAIKKVKSAELTVFTAFLGGRNLEYKADNVSNVFSIGVSHDYGKLFTLELEKGRYFSVSETGNGSDVMVIGHTVAEKLFPRGLDPIGKRVKFLGRKMRVIGVIKEEGENLIDPWPFDELALIPVKTTQRSINFKGKNFSSSILIKAKEGINLERLKDDVTGVIRAKRRLRPRDEDNFSMNNISILASTFDTIFGLFGTVGWLIGGLSIFVGMFGVANIMFVSVKERTSVIGVKKALGAKRWMIMLEFIFEAVVLCLIGGLIGLVLVYFTVKGLTSVSSFEIFLSRGNVILGISISFITGITAGAIPAMLAANMDPVVAIRK